MDHRKYGCGVVKLVKYLRDHHLGVSIYVCNHALRHRTVLTAHSNSAPRGLHGVILGAHSTRCYCDYDVLQFQVK